MTMQWESEYMRTWEQDEQFLVDAAQRYIAFCQKKAEGKHLPFAEEDIRTDRERVGNILRRYKNPERGNPHFAHIAQRVSTLLEQVAKESRPQGGTAQTAPDTQKAEMPPAAPAQVSTQVPTKGEESREELHGGERDTGVDTADDNVVDLHNFRQQQAARTAKRRGTKEEKEKGKQLATAQPAFSSDNAREEYKKVQEMRGAFDGALNDMLVKRLDQTIAFGKTFDITALAAYLKRTCGEALYFDSLLSMTQQYARADVPIVNERERQIGKTGFHLAFFGAPGTGKTFAINDLIRGNERNGIPAHGLVGRNRYCASMSAVQFLKMAEAYQDGQQSGQHGAQFNFIVPEFENWFRYAGMTDIIKLALESGEIAHETDRGRIGPYRFSSFFAVNYNVAEKGARGATTLQQNPNFQAIEDRMLATVHEQTPDRYRAVAENAEKVALGIVDFDLAGQIHDHLMLVYAIQSEHPMVSARFGKKDIVIDSAFYGAIRMAREAVLDQLGEDTVPFSSRLERRALQLAAAMTLPGYFAVGSATPQIEICQPALDYAIRFFVTEAAARSGKDIDVPYVLEHTGIADGNYNLEGN